MKTMTLLTGALVGVATLACAPHRADAAGLLLADGGFGGQLEIKEHDVKVTINNGVAVTTVNQVFQNTENRQVEALYTFPVPKGASVSNFSMWINGKEMVGEVVEKEKARQIYNSYKQRRQDPGLLEQVDYRTFEMRVFPIAPKAEQRVQVVYYQELDYDHNWATYVYPLATSTRPNVQAKTTGKFALSVDVKSEIPITQFESTSHAKDFAIAKHAENYQQASLETRGGDLSRDVVLAFQTARPRTGVDLIASKPKDEDGYFSLTLTAGEELAAINKPMDYVFVLDVSGSMADDHKLQLSEQSLGAFVSSLTPEDHFEVMTFNVQPATLFHALTPADDASKKKAQDFLNSQEARGGTILNSAMSTAYKYADANRPLNVIVLSDGMTEQTERAQLVQLIRQRPSGSRVFAIGVGNDVNRGLLEELANDSGGLAAFLSPEDNVQRQAQAFRRKLMRPVASDVAVKIDGVSTYDLVPAKLPNLYHGMPVRVYGRYKGDGGPANVTVNATAAGKDVSQTVKLDFPKSDEANPEIERMWAWKQVDALLKRGDADGSRQSVAPEIIRLGEAYSIATEYTSFLVLENDGEYQRWKIDRRNALRIDRDRGAQQRLASTLERMRQTSPALADLGPAGAEKAEPQTTVVARPIVNASAPQFSSATPVPTRSSGRGADFNFGGGGGGGGAIDPITGIAMAGCGLMAIARVRKTGRRLEN